nr:CCC motif membrane protein [uncultured Brumimicrobium sp.]
MEEIDQEIDNVEIIGTERVPNNVGVLVLGILSIIPGCTCYGLLGVILATISLVLASGANKLIRENPGKYTESSIQLVKAGKICAIIGLSLSILFILVIIAYIVVVGTLLFTIPGFHV